jgi:two-component system cell cycle sensor histidine kinase/response regulator CckA
LRRLLDPHVDLSPGQPALAIFPPAERERVRQALRAALEGAQDGALAGARELVARLEWGDPDSERLIAVSAVPLREPTGCLLLRLTDITRQRRLEAHLARSQRLQTVGSLAGGIAHDFNNLLNAILGAADFVLARATVDPETRDDVEQIRGATERGSALVARLLAFKRGQALPRRVIALDEAVEDLSHLLTRLLDCGIRLERALQAPGRLVRMDPTQLDQVLLNLAVNARDAMPNGGTLTLRTSYVALESPLAREPATVPPGRYVTVRCRTPEPASRPTWCHAFSTRSSRPSGIVEAPGSVSRPCRTSCARLGASSRSTRKSGRGRGSASTCGARSPARLRYFMRLPQMLPDARHPGRRQRAR